MHVASWFDTVRPASAYAGCTHSVGVHGGEDEHSTPRYETYTRLSRIALQDHPSFPLSLAAELVVSYVHPPAIRFANPDGEMSCYG
jgi:hypothetical protein